jgi:hypothetical protein
MITNIPNFVHILKLQLSRTSVCSCVLFKIAAPKGPKSEGMNIGTNIFLNIQKDMNFTQICAKINRIWMIFVQIFIENLDDSPQKIS